MYNLRCLKKDGTIEMIYNVDLSVMVPIPEDTVEIGIWLATTP